MKKVLLVVAVVVTSLLLNKLTELKMSELFLSNNETLTAGESGIITIISKDMRDNHKSCKTDKLVEITLSDGTVSLKVVTVSGMENACKREKGSTCTSYACYAQD